MERKELKEKLDKQISILKTQCKDAKFADSLIGEILSLKGQIDVNQTLVHIESTEEDEVIQASRFKITRNSNAVVWQADGYGIAWDIDGVKVYVNSFIKAYHVPMNRLFELKAIIESGKATKEQEEEYELNLQIANRLCSLQVLAANNETYQALMYQMYELIISEYSAVLDKAVKDELPVEDPRAVWELMEKEDFMKELRESLKEDAKSS